MKLILCFALQKEALPFIALGNCKLKFQQKDIRLYTGKTFSCLVTGIGRIRCATSIGWLNGLITEPKVLVNIGLCGSVKHELFTWYDIAKVTDELTGKSFFPEITAINNNGISTLISVNNPASSKALELLDYPLADMEGFAFCKSAKMFVPASNIKLIKFVSDNGSEKFYDTNWQKPYENCAPDILETVKQKFEFILNVNNIININTNDMLAFITNKINPTFTQKEKLKDALKFAINHYGNASVTQKISKIADIPQTKEQRNNLVQVLIKQLYDV